MSNSPYGISPRSGVFNTKLTDEIVDNLCAAIRTHPTLTAAAHSCGIGMSQLKRWVRQGSMPGCDPELARLTMKYAQSFAAYGAETLAKFDKLSQEGSPGAATVLKYMNQRFKDKDDADVESMFATTDKKSDDLEALLLKPTPRLQGILNKTGWISIASLPELIKRNDPRVCAALQEAGISALPTIETTGEVLDEDAD